MPQQHGAQHPRALYDAAARALAIRLHFEKRWTFLAIAAKIGCHRNTVSRWCHEHTIQRLDAAKRHLDGQKA